MKSRESFEAEVNPSESFRAKGGRVEVMGHPKGKGRIQGFITPLKGGVIPSFESFLPWCSLGPKKGFIRAVNPSESFVWEVWR